MKVISKQYSYVIITCISKNYILPNVYSYVLRDNYFKLEETKDEMREYLKRKTVYESSI
jgi:hypothetical protein